MSKCVMPKELRPLTSSALEQFRSRKVQQTPVACEHRKSGCSFAIYPPVYERCYYSE